MHVSSFCSLNLVLVPEPEVCMCLTSVHLTEFLAYLSQRYACMHLPGVYPFNLVLTHLSQRYACFKRLSIQLSFSSLEPRYADPLCMFLAPVQWT